jgi:sec-independent protein translocase protein TatA
VPFGLGIWEIVILVGVLVLLFGTKGAPAMARRLGSGVKEMKDAVTEMHPRTLLDPKEEPAKPTAPPPRQIEAAAPPPPPAPESASSDADPPAS